MFGQKQKYVFTENEQSELILDEERKCPMFKKSFWKVLMQIYLEYCDKTSLHGIRYLGEQRPLKEKAFWLCGLIVSIYFCSVLINNVYLKWNETPVIVSFAEKSTPVWSIPFPAITICSETKRMLKDKKTVGNYGELYAKLTDDIKAQRPFNFLNITEPEIEEFRTLLQICNTEIIGKDVPAMSVSGTDYYEILDRMLPEFGRNFLICKWFSHFGDCAELFTKTLTEEGICFTFNGLSTKELYRENTYQYQRFGNVSDRRSIKQSNLISNRTLLWSLEAGYAPASDIQTYPARVLGAGARAGLFIALQNYKHEVDYACRGPVQGFKVLLHSPDDVPLVSKQFVRIPMGKEILIAVKPNMITTAAGIAGYHPLRRQCYLNSERTLKFFKTYTQSNCELECLANFTLHKCGCVKFSMPRTMETAVCNEDKIHCYDKAEDDLLFQEFKEELQLTASNNQHRNELACNCMPACTSLVYNTEISQGNFDLVDMLKASHDDAAFFETYPGAQMSRLSIYFKEKQFITSKRSELYGMTDFLANCGGIFGIFMGFSFLSVFEVIYYFSLRLWSDLRNV